MGVACLALLAIAFGVRQLERARQGVTITTQHLGLTPVTVFRPAHPSGPAPVVLIAHGFAGSQQLMQPFALTLARNGYVAITFDFPGHGRNPAPMTGGLAAQSESLRVLLKSMSEMGACAGRLAGTDDAPGRYAVIGHSMASDIVVRHAQSHREVQASVGVSLFAPSIGDRTASDSPRNLLVIDGALEPGVMAAEALRVVGRIAGPTATQDRTYGSFADGTARRATLSPGVEHIGVLYSAHTLAQALDWLDTAFGRPPAVQPFIDARGPWLGLLLLGVVALAWPLSRLLPRVGRPSSVAHAPLARPTWRAWRRQSVLALAPAVFTPLLLWKLPTDFLPLLLGDYLALHFALYGALTLAALVWAGYRVPRAAALTLVLTIALNPQRLFFLAIIVRAILLLFIVYGLFSRWAGRASGHPAVAAAANALAFGAFIAVTFPRVA
jgi:dienelactone hydrolase